MFGITHNDIRAALKIEECGYTVKQAYHLYRNDPEKLPGELFRAIDEYEESLKQDTENEHR